MLKFNHFINIVDSAIICDASLVKRVQEFRYYENVLHSLFNFDSSKGTETCLKMRCLPYSLGNDLDL